MAIKLKFRKGGFVFRPLYLIPGIFTIYIVHYLDQYGMISLLPQVILGLMGGRWFIKGFYESNNRKFRDYQKDQKERKTNRSFLSIFLVCCIFGAAMSVGVALAGSGYWDLPEELSTEQLDEGWKQNVHTQTDNASIANGTFQLAEDSIHYLDDFENMAVGNTTPDGWEGLPLSPINEVCDLRINDRRSVSGNQSMRITPPATDEVGAIGHYGFINGSVLSFWVYFQRSTSFNVTTLGDYIASPSDSTTFANVQFNRNRTISYSTREQNGTVTFMDTGASYSNGWHQVEILHDLLNLTYDVWFDGSLLIDNARTHEVYVGTYMRYVDSVEFLLQYDHVFIDDFQIGEDAYFRQGAWQSQYVLTDAWLIQPHPRDNVILEVTDKTASTGNQSIFIQDFNNSDVSIMEHYFHPENSVEIEFDINFTMRDHSQIDKFYIWCRSLSGVRHVYFFWIESTTNPGYFELRHYDGTTNTLLDYHEKSLWHHVKIDINCSSGSYDIQVDGVNYTTNKFAYSNTDEISSFEFSTSWTGGAEGVYLDNFVFTTNGTEFVNDTFEDDELGKYPGGGGLDPDHYFNVHYQNVTNGSYIDRIVFAQSNPTDDYRDIEFAAYETDIRNGTYINITEANLTSGSFQDLNVSTWYFIKIFLVSNGTETCQVGTIGSEVMFRDLDSFSYEEDDGYFGPRWGGTSVPQFEQPWYNQIWLMLEANSGLLLAGLLLLLALTFLLGERRGRRK